MSGTIMSVQNCVFAVLFVLVVVVDACKKGCPSIGEGSNKEPSIYGMVSKIKSDALLTMNGHKAVRPKCQLDYTHEMKRDVARYGLAYVNQFLPEVGSIAKMVMNHFWKDKNKNEDGGVQACFDNVVKYTQDAFQEKFEDEATMKIKSFKEVIAYLLDAENQYCSKIKPNRITCSITYINRLALSYDNAVLDGPTIMRTLGKHLWTMYFLREYCIIKYTIASRIVDVSNSTESSVYREFTRKIVKDARWCLNTTGSVVDGALQALKGDEIKLGPMYRAMVWRDMKPWFEAIASLAGYGAVTSGQTLELTKGRKIMLRATIDAKPDEQWMECGEGEKCKWSSCPDVGPTYNDSSDPTPYTKCPNHVLYIDEVEPTDKGAEIVVGTKVKLLSSKGGRVVWDIVNKTYQKGCSAWYLEFKLVKDARPSPQNSEFTLEAWDWAGRRRGAGETVADRDWVVLMYANGTPDFRKLYKDPGFFYVEGFIFLLPGDDAAAVV